MNFVEKIWNNRWALRNLLASIYFNFHYFPLKQAIKLPVILYKPHFERLKGKIVLDVPRTRFMMVRWGRNRVPLYPNSGIRLYIDGTIIIRGNNDIGNNSSISVGPKAQLCFGENFSATTTLKLVCFNDVQFGNDVTVGWDSLFMDTDFHRMKKEDGSKTKGVGSISIGNFNWFAIKCVVLKNTKTPSYTTISAQTVLSGDYSKIPEKSVIGNLSNVEVMRDGVYLDLKDD